MPLVLAQAQLICQTETSSGLDKIGPSWAKEPQRLLGQLKGP